VCVCVCVCALSKEKTLAKMERSGLTEKVGKESKIVFRFPDPGTIPPPVLQISVSTLAVYVCCDVVML
jgi:ATP-binding cassette subfamily F protein 2